MKTILITGCTSGIGLETAKFLYGKGYRVVLTGRNEEKLKTISNLLGNAPYIVSDLQVTINIGKIFEYCLNNNLKLDGMLHAAGYGINLPIKLYSQEHMEKQMHVHYYAFLELCKGFYSRQVSNNGASIVAISSLATVTKLKGSALYTCAKSALNTAISVASKEFVRREIRVNGLMPAYVDTRMNDGLDELIDIKERQPMGLIPPDNIAKIVEFLLSDNAKYITGALIPISAGMEF